MRSLSSRTQSLPGNHFGEETPAPSHRRWVLKSVESSSPSHSQLPSLPSWSLPWVSMSPSSHPSFPFSLIPPFFLNPHSTIWRKCQISLCDSSPHLPSPLCAFGEKVSVNLWNVHCNTAITKTSTKQSYIPCLAPSLNSPLHHRYYLHANDVFSGSLLTRRWTHICRTLILHGRLLRSLWLQICCTTGKKNKGNFANFFSQPTRE